MASVFTKIINGELPSFKVLEDDLTIAILALDQINLGHNLRKERVQIPFPLHTMRQSDCGGVPRTPVDKCGAPLDGWAISYDKIYHYDGTWDKQSWIYYISNDVPYLAGIVTACVSGVIKITDLAIGTLQCQSLTDFHFGQ